MTELDSIIRAEIRASGPMSFARFMELALYEPQLGYYERDLRQTGRAGDFYTSVSVGSLYGELLGFELARRLAQLPEDPWTILEAGAHDGQLAYDVLHYMREYKGATFQRVRYVILEPSEARRQKQMETLAPFGTRVRWARSWAEAGDFQGICFSNELLDALPVQVLRWDGASRNWIEWGVSASDERFEWRPLGPRVLERAPAELGAVLPDQFTVEICPAAASWWREAARRLRQGWLVTVDYGLTREEVFLPHRSNGTLRTYARHRVAGNPLEHAGEQDITAHVHFSELIAAGESEGLQTEPLLQQGSFLKTILEQIEKSPGEFPAWTPARRRQWTSLMHPEHLGRSFRTLIQARPGAIRIAQRQNPDFPLT